MEHEQNEQIRTILDYTLSNAVTRVTNSKSVKTELDFANNRLDPVAISWPALNVMTTHHFAIQRADDRIA